MNNKSVIFDLDGVLVSTDHLHYQAWKYIADLENLHFNEQMNHQLRGVSRKESLDIILKNNNRNMEDSRKNELLDIKNVMYVNLLKDLNQDNLLVGAVDILNKLKTLGYGLAVGSSSKNARIILDKLELTHYFDVIVDGNDIKMSKPNPEVFIKAADGLKVRYDQCFVVEDSIAGIHAAVSAQMIPIYINQKDKLDNVISIKELSNLVNYI